MIYYALWLASFVAAAFVPSRIIRTFLIILLTLVYWGLISFRGEGVDADYGQYLDYIRDAIKYNESSRGGYLFDCIAKIVYYAGFPISFIFSVYALSVPIKIYLFSKFPTYSHAIFIGYVGFFIYLHDFTQIRAGLAIALGYWALYLRFVSASKFWMVLAGVSVLVHPSLLLLFAFAFISSYISIYVLFIVMVLSIIIAWLELLNPIIDKLVYLIDSKDLTLYYNIALSGPGMKPFGVFPLVCMSLTLSIGYILPKYHQLDKLTVLFIKMLFMSQISWYLFYIIPVFSGRISQLFLFSIIFLLPILSKITFKFYILIPAAFSFLGFTAFMYAGGLLKDYNF